jgi:hypothetical protein
MLNKRACECCFKEYLYGRNIKWNFEHEAWFDMQWDENEVMCENTDKKDRPCPTDRRRKSIYSEVPDNCPFQLEHILNEERDDVEPDNL